MSAIYAPFLQFTQPDVWGWAKIVGIDDGAATVHYVGFPASEDETFTAEDQRIRARVSNNILKLEHEAANAGGDRTGLLADGTWQVEAVLHIKVVKEREKYLIRWLGWSEDYDSYEFAAPAECITEYKKSLLTRPLRPPPVPFSPSQTHWCSGITCAGVT